MKELVVRVDSNWQEKKRLIVGERVETWLNLVLDRVRVHDREHHRDPSLWDDRGHDE